MNRARQGGRASVADRAAAIDERRWWRRPGRAIPIGVGSILVLAAIVLGVSALVAKSALESAIPLASRAQQQVTGGDSEGLAATVDDVAEKTALARVATGHFVWRAAEALPFIGDDLAAVRIAAAGADQLVQEALKPLAVVDIAALGPKDGRIDLEVLAALAEPAAAAAESVEKVQISFLEIDEKALLSPVRSAVGQLTGAIDQIAPVLIRLRPLFPELPAMLGADGPRNYLVIVQNNAEARSTGGNPAAMMMLTADQGRLAITEQAGSLDFNFGRETPIIPLSPSTQELYTSKVGRWVQDISMTPDFAQTAQLARAFWAESIGDPGDAVLSIDPVVLSYMLEATGPLTLADGEELSYKNAVGKLLNEVYFRYDGGGMAAARMQDAYFASAASSIFGALTGGSANPATLFSKIARAYGEGRIMYAPTSSTESAAIAGTKLEGPLPKEDDGESVLGVFVNDNTEGKLDYYADMAIRASAACTESGPTTFSAEVTYNYTLPVDEVADLPIYISTGNFFPRGVKSTNLVFYGPIGSTYESATVDGVDTAPIVGTVDLGRPAVRVLIENQPATSHVVKVTFRGADEATSAPLSVVHTPLIDDVPIDTSSSGCQ